MVKNTTGINSKEMEEPSKKGKAERKNPRTRSEHGYIIRYGESYLKSFSVTDEQCDKAFKWYAIAKLTINQVALKFGWTREQTWALKTSFGITKTDQFPFTPEKIDSMSIDEMVEDVRIFKKQVATAKYEIEKYKDIEKEVKKYNKEEFWFEKVLDRIVPIDPRPINLLKHKIWGSESIQFVLNITDIHAGLEVDSIFNRYDLDTMDERMDDIALWAVDNIPTASPLIILDKGDIVHGIIHGSVEKYSEHVLVALDRVLKAYIRGIQYLLDHGYKIIFAHSNGNHSSLDKNKKDRIDENNFGNLLYTVMEIAFSHNDNFRMVQKERGTNHCVVPVFGYHIMTAHGDEMKAKALADTAREFNRVLGVRIIEVLGGHWHHYVAESHNDIFVEFSEAVCGTDQYAGGKGYNAPCGFRVTTYTKNGRQGTRFVNLGDK